MVKTGLVLGKEHQKKENGKTTMLNRGLGLLISAISAVLIYFVLASSLKIFLSIEVAVLIYLMYERFVLHSSFKLSLKTGFGISTVLFFLPIVALIFSAIVLVGGSSINSLFLAWNSLSFADWVSVSAAILLSTFLPGFFILVILGYDGELSRASFVVLVPLISVFISSIIAFVTFIIACPLANISIFIIASNAVLAVFYSIRFVAKKEIFKQVREQIFDLNKFSILFILILIISTAIFIVFFTSNSFLKGDMWREFAIASKFSNLTPELMKNVYGSPLWYVYWPGFYLTTLFSISNFPLINAYILLVFLNIFSVVAFYSLARNFFRNIDSAIISTVVWSLFSGFGWIYVLFSPSWLGPVSNRLDVLGGGDLAVPWSISKPFGFWANDISVERSLAFISLLVLLSILLSKKFSVKRVCLSTAFLVAFSYLFHVYEAAIFVLAIWPIMAWFSKTRSDRDKVLISLSVTAGLATVFLLDFFSIYHYYSQTYLSYFMVFALLTATVLLLKSRISEKWRALHVSFSNNSSMVVNIFFVAAYFVAIATYLMSNFQYAGDLLIARVVPWYLYPLKLGVAGLITVLGIGLLVQNKKRLPSKIKFLLITILALIFFGMIVSYVKTSLFSLPYEEMRVVDVMFPFLALATGWVLSRFLFNLSRSRFMRSKELNMVFGGALIAIVLVSGSLGSLLSPEVWSLTTNPWGGSKAIPAGYTDALNFLRLNAAPNTTIATVPGSGDDDLASLSGLPTLAGVGPDMNKQFFEASGPRTFFGIASTWNVQYIYLSDEGFKILQQNYNKSYFYKVGISELPVSFIASGNIIYKIVVPSQYLSSGFGITSENLTLAGQTNIVGSFALPESDRYLKNGLHVNLLDLGQAEKVTVDNVPVQAFSLSNVTIYGDFIDPSVIATIETNGVIIMGMPCEGYVYLFTESYNYTVVDSNISSIHIIVVDKDGFFHQVSYVGSAKFVDVTSSYPLVFGKVPLSVETSGKTTMNRPLFYLTDLLQNNIEQFGGVYKSRVVVGELTFSLVGADNDRVFINNFILGSNSTTCASLPIGQQQNWPGFLSVEIPNIPSDLLIAYCILVIPIIVLIVVIFGYRRDQKVPLRKDRQEREKHE